MEIPPVGSFQEAFGGHKLHFRQEKGDIFLSQTISKDSTAGQQANSIHLLAELGKKNAARCSFDVRASTDQNPDIFLRDKPGFVNEQLETGYATEEGLQRPMEEEEIEPKGDPLKFVKENLALALGLEPDGNVEKEQKPAVSPEVSLTFSKQGQTPGYLAVRTLLSQDITAIKRSASVNKALGEGDLEPVYPWSNVSTDSQSDTLNTTSLSRYISPAHDTESRPSITANPYNTQSESAQNYMVQSSESEDEEAMSELDDEATLYESEYEETPSEAPDGIHRIITRHGDSFDEKSIFSSPYTRDYILCPPPHPGSYTVSHKPKSRKSLNDGIEDIYLKPSPRSSFPSPPGLPKMPKSPLPFSLDQRGDFARVQSRMADLPPGPASFKLGSFPESMPSSLGNISKGNKIQSFGQGGSPDRIQTSGAHLYPRQKTLEEMAGIMPRASNKSSSQPGP